MFSIEMVETIGNKVTLKHMEDEIKLPIHFFLMLGAFIILTKSPLEQPLAPYGILKMRTSVLRKHPHFEA
jgi:hypothetical protein